MLLQMTRPVQAGIRQEKRMENISNHLANSNTTGFKADILSFDQVFKGLITVDHRQGDIRTTGNKLDVSINGDGFFKIQTPQGMRYTRNGNFTLNNEGSLVTQNGDLVQGNGGAIAIQGTEVFINKGGDIIVDGAVVDQLQVVSFDNVQKLKKDGFSLYSNPEKQPEVAPQEASIEQGSLENANITTVVEMTKMIDTHRMYEAFQKVIHSLDETDEKTINEVGRLQ